mmetsp:Transcript_29813/g.30243  ORF Transcript_29813/g.30243 Transcript_29813/m.30243 type:complete len:301 (-) Transcript_29813:258-1160(-)
MPLSLLLPVFKSVGPHHVLLLCHPLKHLQNTRHHPLQSTEVDVGTIAESLKELIGILFHLILDVHLPASGVVLLTRESIVELKVVGVAGLDVLPHLIVEKRIAVGDTKEEPSNALVSGGSRSLLDEKTAKKGSVGSDSGSSGDHDKICLWLRLGHKHDLTSGSSELHFITWLSITQEVRADSLLCWVLGLQLGAPVSSTTDTESCGGSLHVIAISGGGNGVETVGVWLTILRVDSRWDNTITLSFNVWHFSCVVNDDITHFTSCLCTNDSLYRNNLSNMGLLCFKCLQWDFGMIMVWVEF